MHAGKGAVAPAYGSAHCFDDDGVSCYLDHARDASARLIPPASSVSRRTATSFAGEVVPASGHLNCPDVFHERVNVEVPSVLVPLWPVTVTAQQRSRQVNVDVSDLIR